MDTRQPLSQSQVIVLYLKTIFEKHPAHFENLFSATLGVNEQLFNSTFKCIDAALRAALNGAITPEVQANCVALFKQNITTLQQAKISAGICFNFIAATKEWEDFCQEIAKKIEKKQDQQALHERIAGAFTYKVLSVAKANDTTLVFAEEQEALIAKLYPIKLQTLSEVTVEYLEKIYERYPSNFEKLFSCHCEKTGRLFFDSFDIIDNVALVKAFTVLITPLMQESCINSFSQVNPVIQLSFLNRVRDLAAQFFIPISSSHEWQRFWNIVTHDTVTNPDKRQTLFRVIAGAFSFKIISIVTQNNTKYLEEKFNAMQRSYIPKMLNKDSEKTDDNEFITALQTDFYNKVIEQALNYEEVSPYIKSFDDKNVPLLIGRWRQILRDLPQDPRMLSQGESAQIKLNEWLTKAVQHMKKLDRKYKDDLRKFCEVIFEYLDFHYIKTTVSSTIQLHHAIFLCAASRELAQHISSRTWQIKFQFLSRDLEHKQSKLVWPDEKSADKSRKTSSPRLIASRTSASGTSPNPRDELLWVLTGASEPSSLSSSTPNHLSHSPSNLRLKKTPSTGHLTAQLKKESPRADDSSARKPNSARKSSDGESFLKNSNGVMKRANSLFNISPKVKKDDKEHDKEPNAKDANSSSREDAKPTATSSPRKNG